MTKTEPKSWVALLIEERARHEADGRHRRVQQVAQHVDEDPAHRDVATEALEEVGAVAQSLDHRVELVLSHDNVHEAGP